MPETPSEEFPGWDEDESGNLTFWVTIAGHEIRLATVICVEPEARLWETYIGLDMSDENQLGRHDSSRERSVRKAEDYLVARLRKLS